MQSAASAAALGADRCEHLFCLQAHPPAIEKSTRGRQSTETKVLGDRQVLAEREFLMHHADTRREGLFWSAEGNGFAEKKKLAGVRWMNAGQNFSKRALPRAVLAAQCVT
jgi:hypothetical protein